MSRRFHYTTRPGEFPGCLEVWCDEVRIGTIRDWGNGVWEVCEAQSSLGVSVPLTGLMFADREQAIDRLFTQWGDL